jgi:hypothetical protein
VQAKVKVFVLYTMYRLKQLFVVVAVFDVKQKIKKTTMADFNNKFLNVW